MRDVPRRGSTRRGPVPGLAGRSPNCLVRQLRDMRRKRIGMDLMKPVVTELRDEETIAIGATSPRASPSPKFTPAWRYRPPAVTPWLTLAVTHGLSFRQV